MDWFFLQEVWDIDAGDYTCEATNVFGTDTATATLNVQAPPLLEKPVPNAVHPEGDMVRTMHKCQNFVLFYQDYQANRDSLSPIQVRIKIYFSGSAPFTHQLLLNGVEVSPDAPNIRWVDFDDHILLTIPELHAHEAGRSAESSKCGSR